MHLRSTVPNSYTIIPHVLPLSVSYPAWDPHDDLARKISDGGLRFVLEDRRDEVSGRGEDLPRAGLWSKQPLMVGGSGRLGRGSGTSHAWLSRAAGAGAGVDHTVMFTA